MKHSNELTRIINKYCFEGNMNTEHFSGIFLESEITSKKFMANSFDIKFDKEEVINYSNKRGKYYFGVCFHKEYNNNVRTLIVLNYGLIRKAVKKESEIRNNTLFTIIHEFCHIYQKQINSVSNDCPLFDDVVDRYFYKFIENPKALRIFRRFYNTNLKGG